MYLVLIDCVCILLYLFVPWISWTSTSWHFKSFQHVWAPGGGWKTRPTRDMTGTTIVVIVRSLAVPMERASWEKPAVPPGSGRSNELLATFAWPMAPWGPMAEFLRVFQTVCQNPRDAILLTSVNLGCRQPGSIQSRGALISLKQHWLCARCFVDVLRTRLNRTHNSHMALTRSHNHVPTSWKKKQWEMIPPFFP